MKVWLKTLGLVVLAWSILFSGLVAHIVQTRNATRSQEPFTLIPFAPHIAGILVLGTIFSLAMYLITHRWLALQQMRRDLTGQFQGLSDRSSDGIALIDQHGLVVEWNPRLEEITGMARAHVVGQSLWDVQWQITLPEHKTPEYYARVRTGMLQALAAEDIPGFGQLTTRVLQRSDGTRRTVDHLMYPLKTETTFMIGNVVHDVTPRQAAEVALRELNAELESRVLERTASLKETNRALEIEIVERNHAEDQIRQFNRDLERRVMERTQQLVAIVQELRGEVAERRRIEAALRRRVESEQLISEISTRLIHLDPAELRPTLRHALALAGAFVGADRGYVFELSEDGVAWSNTLEWCAPGVELQIENRLRLPAAAYAWWQSRLEHSETISIPHVEDLAPEAEAEKTLLLALGVQSLLVVPMLYGKTLNGFLAFAAVQTAKDWTEEERRLLKLVAEILVNALGRQRMEQAEHAQRQLAEALRDTAASLNSTLESDAVLERILENVGNVVPHDAATIMLIEREVGRVVRSRGYAERGEQEALTQWRPQIAQTIGFRELCATGTAFILADIPHCSEWDASWHTRWEQSYLGVPICSQGEIIGFLNLYSVATGFFTTAHAQRLQAFADQVSVALANAQHYEEAQQNSARMQALSHRLVEIQEIERSRISRELHDEVGQALTSMRVHLLLAEQHAGEREVVTDHLDTLRELTNSVMEDLHRIAVDLRPASLDHAGLEATLRQYIHTFGHQHAIKIQFETFGLEGLRLPVEIETALYRIVQESLTNVARHARARQVDVILEMRRAQLILIVEDNGIGFDADASVHGEHLGLTGLRERAEVLGGALTIESAPGAGTTIQVEIPYDNSNPFGG